jgi:hypothetical protein
VHSNVVAASGERSVTLNQQNPVGHIKPHRADT